MHGEEGDVMNRSSGRQKDNGDSRGSRGELPRTRGSRSNNNRVAYLFPPPVDSPPFIASPREGDGEGVLKRRRNRRATAPRPRGGRRGGFGLACDRLQRGRCSDSNSSRSSGSCGSRSSRSHSSSRSRSSSRSSSDRSRSSSGSGINSDVRDIHCIRGSSSSSGDEGKTHIVVDDLVSVEKYCESSDSGKGGARSGSNSINGKREPYNSRDGEKDSFNQNEGAGRVRKSSGDSAAAFSLEKEHHHRRPSSLQFRNRNSKKKAPTGDWTEGHAAQNARTHNDHEDDDNNGDNGNNNDESPGSHVCRRNNARRSISTGEKAQGSETTATPSPRDHPSGYGRSPLSETFDCVNEGVVGGLAIPTEKGGVTYETGGGSGGGGVGCRHSITSPSTVTRAARQESTLPSPDTLGDVHSDDHGPEIDDSASEGKLQRGGGGSSNGSDGNTSLSRNNQLSSTRRGESLYAMRSHHSEEKKWRSGNAVNKKTSGSASNGDTRWPGCGSPGRG